MYIWNGGFTTQQRASEECAGIRPRNVVIECSTQETSQSTLPIGTSPLEMSRDLTLDRKPQLLQEIEVTE